MTNDDEHGPRHLERALRLEQEVLAQMRALIAQLPDGDPYRDVLERHRGTLEETVGQIEALIDEALGRRTPS